MTADPYSTVPGGGREAPPGWASHWFGSAAAALRQQIPAALQAAHVRACGARVSGGLDHDVYGETLWEMQHAELASHVIGIDTAVVSKPHGSRSLLVVVNGRALYPWRYAADSATRVDGARLREPVRELRCNLSRALALAAVPVDPRLFKNDCDELTVAEAALAGPEKAPLGGRLSLIAYASDPQAGILVSDWGGATLLDDGRVRWQYRENLPLAAPPESAGCGSGLSQPKRPVM